MHQSWLQAFLAHLPEGLVMFDSPALTTVLIFLPGLGVERLAWAWAVIDLSHLFVLVLLFQGQ